MQSQSIGTRFFLAMIIGMIMTFLIACSGAVEESNTEPSIPNQTTVPVVQEKDDDDSKEMATPDFVEEDGSAEKIDQSEVSTNSDIDDVEEETEKTSDTSDNNVVDESVEETADAVDVIEQETYKGVPVGFTDEGNAYMGDPDALVRIEEYSDYQCPFCQRFVDDTLTKIKDTPIANGDAVLIFHDFPLDFHPQAGAAANAARCAGESGAAAYWEMHDILFENMRAWGVSNPLPQFINYAKQIANIDDIESFSDCVESDRYQDKVQADTQAGARLGVRGTPAFLVNGELLSGAQPYNIFYQAITAAISGESIVDEPETIEIEEPQPVVLSDNYAFAIGDEDADVVIIEFTDLQCPYCARYSAETLPSLITDYVETGRVRYEFRDLPLDQLHPLARDASVAARCAGEQNNYLEMHDILFVQQNVWGNSETTHKEMFEQYASELELDVDAFKNCLENGQYDEEIEASVQEALQLELNSTPYFVVNGFPIIRGAQPFENFEYVIELAENDQLVAAIMESQQQQQIQQQQQAQQQQEQPEPVNVGKVPEGDSYVMGDDDAPITIVEYTDYQCPFCSRHFSQTFDKIRENYIDKGIVRYVFKDFPLSFHAQATQAAVAAHCAKAQDAFYEMHQTLFNNQASWGNDNVDTFLSGYAADLGLDVEAFDTCLQSGEYDRAIEEDFIQGSNFGVTGTPAFFVNGLFVNGAQPYQLFEQVIQAQLDQ